MPTYDYTCESCGHCFEVFKAISEPDPEKCPECGGAVRKAFTGGTGIIVKSRGPGFCKDRGESRNTQIG
jgi:putative FmdB family regulatory protein